MGVSFLHVNFFSSLTALDSISLVDHHGYQVNGESEWAVQSLKNLFKTSLDPFTVLLNAMPLH